MQQDGRYADASQYLPSPPDDQAAILKQRINDLRADVEECGGAVVRVLPIDFTLDSHL